MHSILAIFLSSAGPAIVRVEVVRSVQEGYDRGALFSGTADNFAVYRGTHGGVLHEAIWAIEACIAECEGKSVAFSVEHPFERRGMLSYNTAGEGSR